MIRDRSASACAVFRRRSHPWAVNQNRLPWCGKLPPDDFTVVAELANMLLSGDFYMTGIEAPAYADLGLCRRPQVGSDVRQKPRRRVMEYMEHDEPVDEGTAFEPLARDEYSLTQSCRIPPGR